MTGVISVGGAEIKPDGLILGLHNCLIWKDNGIYEIERQIKEVEYKTSKKKAG